MSILRAAAIVVEVLEKLRLRCLAVLGKQAEPQSRLVQKYLALEIAL